MEFNKKKHEKHSTVLGGLECEYRFPMHHLIYSSQLRSSHPHSAEEQNEAPESYICLGWHSQGAAWKSNIFCPVLPLRSCWRENAEFCMCGVHAERICLTKVRFRHVWQQGRTSFLWLSKQNTIHEVA